MKKLILIAAIAGLFTQVQAQDKVQMRKVDVKEVPAVVSTAFNKAHSTIKDVEWRMDGKNYTAEYDENKTDMYVTYSPTGELIGTKSEIKSDMLPAPVIEYVKKSYDEDEMRDVSKVTDANGMVTYEGEVKGMKLIFDADGKFVKSEKK